jgi:hypothetical protein
MAQADFGRNHKPALEAKLFVFFDFSLALAFRKVLFVFSILSPPRVAQSRLPKSHIKVRFVRQLKSTSGFKSHIQVRFVRQLKSTSVFKSHIKVRFARQLKSTSVFKSRLKVRSTRHKVDFGFQVAF